MTQPKVISAEQALKEIRAMHPEVADLMEKNLVKPENGTIASKPKEVVDINVQLDFVRAAILYYLV